MHWNEHQEPLDSALTLIHSRQSTSSRFLGDPGPGRAQIETILDAAGAAPDQPISYGELVKRTGIEFLPGVSPGE